MGLNTLDRYFAPESQTRLTTRFAADAAVKEPSPAASSGPEEDPASTPSALRSSRALEKLSASGIANARDTSERSALGGTKSSPMPSTAQLPACTMRPV